MAESTFNPPPTKGTKPRLSLLSTSRQAGIRIKSEDSPEHQISVPSSAPDSYADLVAAGANPNSDSRAKRDAQASNISGQAQQAQSQQRLQQQQQLQPQESQRTNGNNSQDNDTKMNISKEDLIRLLSMLKSELQSKEIALAAIKCEQLKRLINPVEISRSALANTYIELQDRFKRLDVNNNAKNVGEDSKKPQKQSASGDDQGQTIASTEDQPQSSENTNDRESLNILNTLLELLDRHPLLALPRDSIYCLDYNCNELSTKNYLNLKIQHLDNLINQHRRFRYYMNEHLKRSEQRNMELTRELEIERSSKIKSERSLYKTSGRTILLKHIEHLKECLEKEKESKQAIVMTLLNELLDERERNETLKKKPDESVESKEKNTGEMEKRLRMEAELNSLTLQLRKQSMIFSKERTDLQTKLTELENENKKLKEKLEHQSVRPPVASNKPSTKPDTKDTEVSDTVPVLPRGSVSTKNVPPLKHVSTGQTTPAVVTRSSLGAVTIKSSPAAKTPTQSSNSGSGKGSNPGVSSIGGASPSSSTTSRQASTSLSSTSSSTLSQTASSSNVNPQRNNAPNATSRILGGSSTDNPPIRIQPLFKAASISSTGQQGRNLKTPPSTVAGGPLTGSSSSSSTPNVPLARSSSTNQPVTKPQVPAKPAQLLDQQRNSLN